MGERRAMAYLSTLANYRLVHHQAYVELQHWGEYEICSQGFYCVWETVHKYTFKETNANYAARYNHVDIIKNLLEEIK